jgi:hypothetical protein
MPDLLPPGLVEMITESERDLLARRRLYHNRTYTRRLSQEKAERRLEVVAAIIENLRAQLPFEELIAFEAARKDKKARRQKKVA